jgi:hypothetical protein
VDSHMGTVFHLDFVKAYVESARKAHVPVMLPRADAAMLHFMGMDDETATKLAGFIGQLEEQGLPLVDRIAMMPLDQPEGQLEIAEKMLSELPAGVTHFIIHPSIDTPELRAIARDWPSRAANYLTFMNPKLKGFIKDQGILVIGYKALRDLLRKS